MIYELKNMRYHLAHSRDIKKNGWNNRCPSCGQRKFSPYIDSHTGKPIDEKHCGRCCRERSCAYHMTPSEWFKEHPQEKREWLPREQYVELMRQRKKEAEDIRRLHTNSPSVYRGATRESVACDDGNFSSPKSSQEGVAFPFGRRTRFQAQRGVF